LIYLFSYGKALPYEKVLSANLDLVDIMMTMSKSFDKALNIEKTYDFRKSLSHMELQNCYQIAEQTAAVSRFYTEKMIGVEKTKQLYRKWIDNACNNEFSDGLFVIKDPKMIVAGLHLIKIDKTNKTGYFTLTGVKKDLKRSGIGRQLWNQSFGYFANENDINIVKSPFSLNNIDSLNFHLKMGFNKVEEIKYIYHFRNEN
jgi:ribosomal protein S18 acetylase RimI-like enzyme